MNFLRIAWHGAYRRRGRLLLVLLPTAVLFAIVVFLANVEFAFHGLRNDDEEKRTLRIGSPIGQGFLGEGDVARIRRIPHVVDVGVEDWTGLVLTKEKGTEKPSLGGSLNPTQMRLFASNMFYVPPDKLAKFEATKNGIILGKIVAERHGWKEGDLLTLPARVHGEWRDVQFQVVYVAERGEMLDLMILREGYLAELWKTPMMVLTAFAIVDKRENLDAVRAEVAKILAGRPLESLKLTLADTKSYVARKSALMLFLFRATGICAMAMLLVLTLATVVLLVEERRRELATLRALGYTTPKIGALVLLEGILLVLPGVLLGTGITFLYYHDKMIEFGEFTRITLDWRPVAIAVPVGILLAAIGAAIPAVQAMRMPLLSALRDD